MAEAKDSGTIVQCIGAVIDIEFPREARPGIYDALVLEDSDGRALPRRPHLRGRAAAGDGVVRCIALRSSDGLRRGMSQGTGKPISVPVGKGI